MASKTTTKGTKGTSKATTNKKSNDETTKPVEVKETSTEIKKKEKKPQKKKQEQVVENVIEDVVEETVEETVEEHTSEEDAIADESSSKKEIKKRTPPTKESIIAEFDQIISLVESEIDSIRENKNKTKGIKFLRTLNKKLKSLKTQTTRLKQRSSNPKKDSSVNTNSGFLKPVKISNEMAKFTGWDVNELKSRVDVTKYLCNYIRENNLQNPSDKRQIIADAKLAKLIKFDPKKESEPLTYYRLQTYLKNHFIKPEISA